MQLEVATWNVLAPAYALPSRYDGVARTDLDPQYRMPRVESLLDRLLDECDVVALQEVDAGLAEWLTGVAGCSAVWAKRPSSVDGAVLASRHHLLLDAEAATTSDGRRTWATARVAGCLVVSVHLDPEWPQKRLRGAAQAAELVGSLEDVVGPVVVLGDINSSWDRRTGQALAWGGFEASRVGATAATNGRTRELEVVCARGCTLAARPTGLPEVGTPLWLPTSDLPSDHAPVRATVTAEGPALDG